jgi:hypothetical protein
MIVTSVKEGRISWQRLEDSHARIMKLAEKQKLASPN